MWSSSQIVSIILVFLDSIFLNFPNKYVWILSNININNQHVMNIYHQ